MDNIHNTLTELLAQTKIFPFEEPHESDKTNSADSRCGKCNGRCGVHISSNENE